MTESDRRRYRPTVAAAAAVGRTRTALLSITSRARAAGIELQAPRDLWPDARTPLWDVPAIVAYLADRPGRGANLRKTGPADNGA